MPAGRLDYVAQASHRCSRDASPCLLTWRAERYVALSYCWGGRTPLRTTWENLKSHIRSLSSQDLPQTFVDAIAVTSALGVKYIWIDSICIVQDSEQDWAEQSACMAKIYENAYVTISADAAEDSFAGFLRPPARVIRPTFSVPYSTTDENGQELHGEIRVRERGKLAIMLPYHDWLTQEDPKANKSDLMSSPEAKEAYWGPQSRLSTRGWVFQERCLAPRTLHFGSSEMAYECRSICTCECSATSVRPVRNTSLLKQPIANLSLEENRTHWRNLIVQEYSRLSFTFASDRLIALSGLAEATYRLRSEDEYLTGLWRKTLCWDWLWRSRPVKQSKRIPSYIAPSWSWASITGAVMYSNTIRNTWQGPSFQIKDIRLVRDDINPFGNAQRGAYIYALGPVLPVRISTLHEENELYLAVSESYLPRGLPEWMFPQKELRKDELDGTSSSKEALLAVWDVFDGPISEEMIQRLKHGEYVFLMTCYTAHGPCGLLLRELPRQAQLEFQVYERVAYVCPVDNPFTAFSRSGSWESDEQKRAEQEKRRAIEDERHGLLYWRAWTRSATEISLGIF